MSRLRRSEFLALVAATSVGLATKAWANDFPTRPVELVVGFPPGGGTDVLARAFADAAKRHMSQPLLVTNRPGASGSIGLTDVLNTRADGHKLALVTAELAILPALNQVRFSADDFRMIAQLNADPAAILVRNEAPWATIEDFIAEVRRRPGHMKVGDSGVGSIYHLSAAAMADRVGAEFLHAPFAGSAPGLTALLGGHIDAMTTSPAEASAHVLAGRLRILAVMADARLPTFENVPTLKERGVDLSIGTWRGLAVRRDTPQQAVDALAEITRRITADTGFREAVSRSNLALVYADGRDFEATINRDRTLFRQLVTKLQLG